MSKNTQKIFLLFTLWALLNACSIEDIDQESTFPDIMPKPAHLGTSISSSEDMNSEDRVSTPKPESTQLPTSNLNVLFNDDFSDPNSGWDKENYDTGSTEYLGGAYRIIVNTDYHYIWGNPYKNYTDVIVEVETKKLAGGDDDYYGIICRHQDIDNYIALTISSDGFSIIKKRTSGGIENLNEYTKSSAINTGIDGQNILRAECIGNRFTLYANGEFVSSVFDTSIPSGDVGLIAGALSAASNDIAFDNFIVYEP